MLSSVSWESRSCFNICHLELYCGVYTFKDTGVEKTDFLNVGPEELYIYNRESLTGSLINFLIKNDFRPMWSAVLSENRTGWGRPGILVRPAWMLEPVQVVSGLYLCGPLQDCTQVWPRGRRWASVQHPRLEILGVWLQGWSCGGQPACYACSHSRDRTRHVLTHTGVGVDTPCPNFTQASPKHVCCSRRMKKH